METTGAALGAAGGAFVFLPGASSGFLTNGKLLRFSWARFLRRRST